MDHLNEQWTNIPDDSKTSLEGEEVKEVPHVDHILLYDNYRLIEKPESEVNKAWKGVHMLLFFLAFVFGSLCTFCFHLLMYMFDEKCVLFPKLLSMSAAGQSLVQDYVFNQDSNSLPVDFLSTQWVDKSTCLLPTYVPLVSGICGLVWSSMFLMCSSGNKALTGLQRPWRILPAVLLFSLALGSLSIYTSVVTHTGLDELCFKLAEITGSESCTYTINVATLAYERRIRGVYQATRLTILSAWLHTICWLLEAVVTLARILLVIDFRLVRIRADLHGNVEKMLERHEKHVRTVSPDTFAKNASTSITSIYSNDTTVRFVNGEYNSSNSDNTAEGTKSKYGLVVEEKIKLDKLKLLEPGTKVTDGTQTNETEMANKDGDIYRGILDLFPAMKKQLEEFSKAIWQKRDEIFSDEPQKKSNLKHKDIQTIPAGRKVHIQDDGDLEDGSISTLKPPTLGRSSVVLDDITADHQEASVPKTDSLDTLRPTLDNSIVEPKNDVCKICKQRECKQTKACLEQDLLVCELCPECVQSNKVDTASQTKEKID